MQLFSEILGDSPAMQTVRDTLSRLLGRQQPGRRLPTVLLHGETGTGKGLVARLLHRYGPRASGQFVAINCAAIPETLLEAELFGFERGAFTDARHAKPGLFHTAHRGTLFLDEVGLLPDRLQAKLLTVIEEQSVRRLGGTRGEPADAWIISATNADLQAAIRERQFREDLYHRLAVLTLRLPPLRERGTDVLLLAEVFLARVCSEYGLPPRTLARDARERLLAYGWPGNVRELSNVIERTALLGESATIVADSLELGGTDSVAPPAPVPSVAAPASAVSMDDAMREHLRAALDRTGWNISRTAAQLGITRNTLRARIEKFGLQRGDPIALKGRNADPAPVDAMAASPGQLAATPSVSVAPGAVPATAPPIRWERRHITLVRANLAVDAAEDEFPDTGHALDLLVQKVRAFGGRVEELSTTGIDASFGLEPIEDAPRRAANAVIAILKAVERARRRGGETLAVRIAIHTAACLVGEVSGSPEIEHRAKRDSWLVLDGLLALAEPNSCLLSATTVPFLDRRFELVCADSPSVPTGEQPYRLIGRDVTGLGLWGRMTKFVGRRYELELLRSRWAAALRGQGQLVGLVGEPGVGKSRLVWEFTRAPEDDALRLETGCVALGNPAPYLPIVELLKRYFEIDPDRDHIQVQQKMRLKVAELDPALLPFLPALLTLLDVPHADEGWAGLSSVQRRQRTFEAVKQLLLCESRRQPLLVVFEDVHWIDAESQALLDSLVEGLPTARALVLLTYRPEYQHGWGSKGYYTQLRVDALPTESAEELVDSLLGGHESVLPLRPMLIEWTEGNPFFLEESVRTLVESEALVGERGDYRLAKPVTSVQVPATIEDVLAVRVERLAGEQRRLLQSAAVIGRIVPYPVLAAIAEVPEDVLGDSLRRLHAAEFLYETSAFPDREYTFKHALTQEIAYASVAQGKRALHARILEVMERLYGDRTAEHLDRLAHHAYHGHVWPKALGYLRRAGQRSRERSANREAAALFERALEALERLPRSRETDEQAIDIRIELRNALTLLGEWERTHTHLRRAALLAEGAGDLPRLGRVLSFESNCLFLLGQHREAIAAGERALTIAHALDDFALAAATKQYLGRSYQSMGNYSRAIELFGGVVASLAGGRLHDHLGLPALPAVFSGSHLAACLAEVGELGEALRQAESALRLAESTSHPDTQLWAYRGIAFVHLVRGDGPAAEWALKRALELCHAGELPTYVPRVSAELAMAQTLAGHPEAALPLIEHALALALARHQNANAPYILRILGEAQCLTGRLDAAAASAQRAADLFRQQGESGNLAHVKRLEADVASRREPPDHELATRLYAEAAAVADKLGMRPLAARCALGRGLLLLRCGDRDRAHLHLATASAQLREMQMTHWLEQAEQASRSPVAQRGSVGEL